MYDLDLSPDNFNPRVLYSIKGKYNHLSKVTFHAHDYIEIKYILSGGCTYKINNNFYSVKKGDIILCNSGVSHEKIMAKDTEMMEFCIGINNVFIKNFPKNHLTPENISPVIKLQKYEQDFFKCCNEIFLEQERYGPGRDLMLKALGMKLIVILLKDIFYRESPEEKDYVNFESYEKANIVNTIISYINENYMKEISLDKISKNMYLSPIYISKIFKEETGDSPINYLIKFRLSIAEKLLREGHLSIKEIAKNVGYFDAYYFSKLFKKYYGCSPKKFVV